MKKGFTLVELLAVIVILAIIALIATPIVLSIINDSKRAATIQSAEFYLDATINAIMKENLRVNGQFNPTTCAVNEEGNISCDEFENTLIVEIDGEKPKGGEISFNNGNVSDATLEFEGGTVSLNTDNQFVYQD